MYDVLVIGAGVTGCAAARELSRYRLSVCVLERAQDVCEGTSKANSGIVHAGYDAPVGSLKAKFNVEGNRRMGELSKELDFPFQQNGSMVLCFSKEDRPKLQELYERGQKNQVKDLVILDGEQARELEPGLNEAVEAALYAPSGGIVCPFELTIALAENACTNGAEFFMETEVTGVERQEGYYLVRTSRTVFESRIIVNCAGVYADTFHNMVSQRKIRISARRGEYCLLDKQAGTPVSKTIFQLPNHMGKGILVTPTVYGNLLIGPTAEETENKEAVDTTAAGLKTVLAVSTIRSLPVREVITSFTGLRAHEDGNDFIVGELPDAQGFYDAAGIESPGLSCAPAMGSWLAKEIAHKLSAGEKTDFTAKRKGIVRPCNAEERAALIGENPAYGNMVCRCEMVSEAEIVEAIRRPLGAKTLDAVKRRTGAGMGRCQAGFCTGKVMEILMRELKIPAVEVTKKGKGSGLILGLLKEDAALSVYGREQP